MLREYAISEAMHALGIPTTRALAVVATGDDVARETLLPGAVLVRVAASHVRVGTFQYAAAHGDPALVRRLADHAIARHHPHALEAENPYLAFFEAVVDAQASLIARWMLVGFIHGVMNTDNMTISGETIDYGPCAFMDAFDPTTVFSSIDHGGRYAYGNQPAIAQWNLARLGETLLPLLDAEPETAVAAATDVLRSFPDRYDAYWGRGMDAKLGLADGTGEDDALIDDLLALLHAQAVDFTSCFRALSSSVRGDAAPARSLFTEPCAFDAWSDRWRAQLSSQACDPRAIAEAMDRVNPVYIPRNHHVEEALAAASAGDLQPFRRLLDVLAQPFHERPGLERTPHRPRRASAHTARSAVRDRRDARTCSSCPSSARRSCCTPSSPRSAKGSTTRPSSPAASCCALPTTATPNARLACSTSWRPTCRSQFRHHGLPTRPDRCARL